MLPPYIRECVRHGLCRFPGVVAVCLPTDIADYPPHFWIERQDQYVICGSERAAAQARELGTRPERIFRTSGMILNLGFYEPTAIDREAERIRLGLRPDIPTGVVLFGGEGSHEMVRIAEALNRAGNEAQLMLLCGKNQEVAANLRAMEQRIPTFIQGFTRDVPYYMELADFFIGKPGPGSISEAFAKRLPVIVHRNMWTMAHERYNADWIEEQGLGVVVGDFSSGIFGAVQTLPAPGNYAQYRQRVAGMHNTAVYEIPAMLAKILSDSELQMPLAG